jgi:hypothetical protein
VVSGIDQAVKVTFYGWVERETYMVRGG